MRLGFYTNYSAPIAAFAEQVGFNSLQLGAWPNTSLDADKVTNEDLNTIKQDLAARNIEISALGYYPNPLDPDTAKATESQRYLRKVIELAERMDVPTVATFAGEIPGAPVHESLPAFHALFKEIVPFAEDHNVKIAIENCPMKDHRTGKGENIAYTPEIWDEMFSLIPSESFGLQLDPSHLVYQDIDYIQATRDYGTRIFHVHAKDIDINKTAKSRLGIYGTIKEVDGFGNGWWRFRTPGWGVINWEALISTLIETGYTGNLDIEHEDEVFAAAALASISEEADIVDMFGREQNGLILGYRHLANLVPPVEHGELLPR